MVLGFGMMFMDLLGLGLVIISLGLIGFYFFLTVFVYKAADLFLYVHICIFMVWF